MSPLTVDIMLQNGCHLGAEIKSYFADAGENLK